MAKTVNGLDKSLQTTLDLSGYAAKSHGTHVTYSSSAPKANGTATAGSANNVARGDHIHPLQTTVSGNAGSATKLATARTLTIGSTGKTFDGSANVSWSLSEIGAAASSHTHSAVNRTMTTTPIYNPESGVLVDFNLNEKSSAMVILKLYGNSYSSNPPIEAIYQFYDYSGGPIYNPQGSAISGQAITLKVYRVGGKIKAWFAQPQTYCTFRLEVTYGNNSTVPNVTLSNAAEPTGATETITITPNRVYSAAFKPSASDIGAAASSHGTHVTWSTTTPKVAGTAAVGTETKVARGDHVHPLQTTVSGNAGSATKLATARTLTIGSSGKTFDGSANVSWTLSEIGAAASSHTHTVLTVKADNYKKGGDLPSTYERGETLFFSNNPASADRFNGMSYGLVQTLKEYGSGSAAWQFLYPYNSNEGHFYVRQALYGTDAWKGWAEVYTSLNKPSLSDLGAAAASHGTHLTIGTGASNAAAGNHTHSYAGSSSAGGAANSVKTNLIVKLNGGSTEGTNLFTFNGSTAKTINITPSAIGAAASSHGTHLTIGTGASNAAAGNHTHSNYATTTTTNTLSSNIGTLSSLQTSAKGSLVAAVNELFQSVDSGKQLIADAIGDSNITKDSTYSAMSEAIKKEKTPACLKHADSPWLALKGSTGIATLTGQTSTYNVWKDEVYIGTYCKYNPLTDVTTLLGGQTYSMYSYTQAVDDNNIYIFYKNKIYVYNLTTKTLTTYSKGLTTSVDGYGVTAENIRGKIYTMGNSENVIQYDPATNTVTNLAIFAQIEDNYVNGSEYDDFVSTKFQDRYYVVQSCGYTNVDTGKGYHNDLTKVFDVETKQWSTSSSGRFHSSINGRMCANDVAVYKIGGYYSSYGDQDDVTYSNLSSGYSYTTLFPMGVQGGHFFAIGNYIYYFSSDTEGYLYALKAI